MPNFVAYYRVSTDRQGESGLGLDARHTAVAGYVARQGGTICAEFQEIESGKAHSNRPKLAAALDECRRRRAVLVIAKLDRLARDVHFISGLMKSGVEFVALHSEEEVAEAEPDDQRAGPARDGRNRRRCRVRAVEYFGDHDKAIMLG